MITLLADNNFRLANLNMEVIANPLDADGGGGASQRENMAQSLRTSLTRPFHLATLICVAAAAPALAEPAGDDLAALRQPRAPQRQMIDPQQRQITALQSTRQGQWLDERRAEEVKGLIREVLADADTRASLLQEGATAGHDSKGFFLKSADGNYLLRVKGLLEARYAYSYQDDAPDDDHRGGFEMGRTRFGFQGHVVDPSWEYFIWTGYNNAGSATLLDATITKKFDHGLSVTAGQFKVPLWKEWLISETSQQFVERSLLNSFSGLYTQGIRVDYSGEKFRVAGSFNDGLNNSNTPFATEDVEYAFSGRGEVLLAGQWGQWGTYQAWRGDDTFLVLGAAAHYQQGEEGTATVDTESTSWTVDLTGKWQGFSGAAAVIGQHIENGVDVDRLGVLLQAGYFVTDQLEFMARYEWGDLDDDVSEDLSIATVGANYFFARHQARLTVDIGYAFNSVPAGFASSLAGWRTDSADADGQIVARSQLQLTF